MIFGYDINHINGLKLIEYHKSNKAIRLEEYQGTPIKNFNEI